jgi:Fe2+-dicitrate sensor, membrane component
MEDKLLIRFLERKCEGEEARLVLQWIEQSEENKAAFVVCNLFGPLSKWIKRQSLMKPASAPSCIRLSPRIRRNWYRSIATIASCAAAILLFVFVYPYFNRTPEYDYEALLKKYSFRKRDYVDARFRHETETSRRNSRCGLSEKAAIIVNDTLQIEKDTDSKVLNTLHIPYGKRSKLILADGTLVFLNAGSTLIYPSEFSGSVREVYLDGEAYFDVRKSKDIKFQVKTAYKTIEVLGTQFNVSVDKESKKFETVLVNGRIALNGNERQIEIEPNQYYVYSESTRTEQIRKVDVADYISWKDGRLRFKEERMESVLRKLEKIYNINVNLKNPKYLTYQVTGNLNLKNTPEETLDVLMSILVPDNHLNRSNMYQLTVNK